MQMALGRLRETPAGAAADHRFRLSGVASGAELASRPVDLRSLVRDPARVAHVACTGNQGPDSIPTGFREFDARTGGLAMGSLTILAAAGAMGISTLGLQIALGCAAEHNVLSFPLDDGAGGVIQTVSRTERAMSERRAAPVSRGNATLPLQNLLVDDTPALSARELSERVTALLEGPPQLVLIDTLSGLFPVDRRPSQGCRAAQELRRLAIERQIAVLCLVRLPAWPVRRRRDAAPRLSQLRSLGHLERVADTVMFLTRPAYYGHQPDIPDEARLAVSRHPRDGPFQIRLRRWSSAYFSEA